MEPARSEMAFEAARLICDEGVRDYEFAKRKAAERLGLDARAMPSNREIEQAVVEHQRLFRTEEDVAWLRTLRETALEAMDYFGDFHPRLVGPVLEGTADRFSAVCLHLFADPPDAVAIFLMENEVPFDESEHRFRISRDQVVTRPCFLFRADDVPLDLTVFSETERRQAPLSSVTQKPMRRASVKKVRQLLQAS